MARSARSFGKGPQPHLVLPQRDLLRATQGPEELPQLLQALYLLPGRRDDASCTTLHSNACQSRTALQAAGPCACSKCHGKACSCARAIEGASAVQSSVTPTATLEPVASDCRLHPPRAGHFICCSSSPTGSRARRPPSKLYARARPLQPEAARPFGACAGGP
eukprot:scaffold3743_cov389-Prasinococcus_capsulatus_cf.AAC.21